MDRPYFSFYMSGLRAKSLINPQVYYETFEEYQKYLRSIDPINITDLFSYYLLHNNVFKRKI
jgi:hypothetical protein